MIPNGTLLPLTIPVPPMFERALGSPGPLSHPDAPAARYCAFYWTEAGDEAAFDDGQQSGAGMLNNDAYLAFVRHPAVAPHLHQFNLGSSEAPADFWLILDRQQRQFFVAPVGVAKPLAREQWEPPLEHQQGPLVVTLQDLQRALDVMQQRKPAGRKRRQRAARRRSLRPCMRTNGDATN